MKPGRDVAKSGDPFGGEEPEATVKMEARSVIAGVGGMEEEGGLESNAGTAISAF